jgi:uncharacterized protein (DUF488 family)
MYLMLSKSHRGRKNPIVCTIGHSTRPLDAFIELLQSNGIQRVIDIRTIPRSRHNPQYNRDALAPALLAARISYVHLKSLGGLRRASPVSTNVGWHNPSFRGFADYMQTPEFESGLARALRLAEAKPSALMCAEAVPWRCHRSLVADAMLVRGFPVEHILGGSHRQRHKITPFARVRGQQVTYPSDAPQRSASRRRRKK